MSYLSWKWKMSRYWNRLMYRIIRRAARSIWDETGGNGYILKGLDKYSGATREIMCHIPKKETPGA